MTDSEQCDYAQVGYAIERLAIRGFGISVNKRGESIEVYCSNVKVSGGIGSTLHEALDEFVVNMHQAGWINV